MYAGWKVCVKLQMTRYSIRKYGFLHQYCFLFDLVQFLYPVGQVNKVKYNTTIQYNWLLASHNLALVWQQKRRSSEPPWNCK